jgi:chromosomal replication initiation ATPase DnaA
MARWRVALPDLGSRLRAITAVEITPAGERLLRLLLARLLSDRQLLLPESLQDWLLRRLPRTPAALREAVARIDRAALIGGCRVTRAFTAAVLADLPGSAPDDEDFALTPTAASASAPGFL